VPGNLAKYAKIPKERRAKSSREGVKYSTLVVLPN